MRWNTEGLWTEVDPVHVQPGIVAEYDILAGPPAGLMYLMEIGAGSNTATFALHRTAGDDEALFRHFELPEKVGMRENGPFVVQDTASLYGEPIVRLAVSKESEFLAHELLPAEVVEYAPEPMFIRLRGHVGRRNGIVSVDPDTKLPQRLMYEGVYFPQRHEDIPGDVVKVPTGIGKVSLNWAIDYTPHIVRSEQVMLGLLDL